MGYEGLMLKDLNAPYHAPSTSSRSKHWVKWKRRITHDAFISGFIPGQHGHKGLVGSLLISQLQDNIPVEIGGISNFPKNLRFALSDSEGNLKQDYYNRVVEVFAHSISKNNRLRHCNILRWRDDKIQSECIYTLGV